MRSETGKGGEREREEWKRELPPLCFIFSSAANGRCVRLAGPRERAPRDLTDP